jgi:hypothetical protein
LLLSGLPLTGRNRTQKSIALGAPAGRLTFGEAAELAKACFWPSSRQVRPAFDAESAIETTGLTVHFGDSGASRRITNCPQVQSI